MLDLQPHPYIEIFSKESVFKPVYVENWPPTKDQYIDAINNEPDPQKKKELAFMSLLVGITA